MTGTAHPTPSANLAAVLEAGADAGGWLDDVAYLVGERRFTHREVHDGAARAASVLAGLGADRGGRVLIALPDGIELVWAFLGAVRLGAVAVPVNPRLTPADHGRLADDANAAVVVCPADLAARFAGRAVLAADSLEAALAAVTPGKAAAVEPGDAAYAQYTSGTTGSPKGALHAHGHPERYFEAFARPALSLARDDVVLSVSKLHFAYGLGNALFFPLLAGCRAVLHAGHPRPDDIADLLVRHRVSVLFAVPTFFAHLVAAGPPALPPLRAAISAGEALSPALAERARAVLGGPILDGLGSTEVGQTFASNTVTDWRDGAVGRALAPFRVRVRDGDGTDMPPGEEGDLWVAGPTLLLGYLDGQAGVRPAPTSADGWLSTGDRAVLGPDGFLRLRGRSDDMELVGGICVAPAEVEEVLDRHPAVTEVAVAGVVEGGASRLLAFVVAAPDSAPHEIVAGELLALARSELAPFKVPRAVMFVEHLPRTPTGKLRRFLLRDGTWGGTDPTPDPPPDPPDRQPERQPATADPKRSR